MMVYDWAAITFLILFLCFLTIDGVKNKISDVETDCDENVVNVTLHFENEFNGVIHVKGSDCLAVVGEKGQSSIFVQLLARKCFLRVYKELGTLWYTGALHVQMSETVLQATDPTVPIKCALDADMLTIKHNLKRTGRKMGGRNDEEETLGKAWLEVRGSAISTLATTNSLDVGEHTLLSVYTSLPGGMSARPVECKVEDGRGGVQALTDERGCTMDPQLLPSFKIVSPGHWATAFPAFSFPDSQLVHYKCILMICSGECPEFNCSEDINSTRGGRDFQDEAILDLVELYNSVEVTAPNIDFGYLRKEAQIQPQGLDENGWVCMSGPKVALVFATLGALFLAAVFATLLLLVRHRRRYLKRYQYGLYT
ncbi:hypothetical protein GE061_017398 [Apolygus lucorum]|uniref:Uncharacterized protein n=1 Tax=Apolygus lucorum TaxID=248454 RepID=A0A6A4JD64_APOLU|nr:hypothetical protein GE061_017398 [Apolygus lucorum]